MSILRANPSIRDSKNYLASFGAKGPIVRPQQPPAPVKAPPLGEATIAVPQLATNTTTATTTEKVLDTILDPAIRRTALVKLQGPFTSRQLASIAQGMVYLEKLGLVSVIVVESDEWTVRDPTVRRRANEMALTVATALEQHGSRARPILDAVVRLGPKPDEKHADGVLESHTYPEDLIPIRRALASGEIPILTPFAMDSHSHCVNVSSNHIIGALVRGMAEVGSSVPTQAYYRKLPTSSSEPSSNIDLTPLRLMIINKEGGIPSYARAGLPHLLVNLDSEYSFIKDSFNRKWKQSNPTALTNLSLAKSCLTYMPPDASAIMVSHRSKSSLIANLITNKPFISSSLPHALLKEGNLNPDTPTILRKGLPIQVIKDVNAIDKTKLTELLEKSFNKKLDSKAFYDRLSKRLDFVIVAGDYVGAAIVTQEPIPDSPTNENITYLDKFAVLPSHQGDGTVDFLWVALHDESYGLGHPYSVNPNGGNEGKGIGRDLVWRSRANNPINKWYFERSSGHVRTKTAAGGEWVLFWCDAEMRLKESVDEKVMGDSNGMRRRVKMSYLENGEEGRMDLWEKAIGSIPSVWS